MLHYLIPGTGNLDAGFMLEGLIEKYRAKIRKMYFLFFDIRNGFDRVPRKMNCNVLRKHGKDKDF